VNDLNLSVSDFREILTACEHIRVPSCTPDYLQDFIVGRLQTAGLVVLADQVAQLNEEEMDALCCHIRDHQAGHADC
jgi:hypothetical protein